MVRKVDFLTESEHSRSLLYLLSTSWGRLALSSLFWFWGEFGPFYNHNVFIFFVCSWEKEGVS